MCCWCPLLSELCWLANSSSLKAWIQLLVAKPDTWAKLCTVVWVNRRGQRVALFSLLLLLLTWAQMSFCHIDKGNLKSHSEITGLLSELFQDRRHPPPPPVCRVVWSVLPRWVDTAISRAHCFQELSAQSGRSCRRVFSLSGHVWILEDKETVFHSQVLPLALPSWIFMSAQLFKSWSDHRQISLR